MDLSKPIQERTNGECIQAFRSGDAIGLVLCRISKHGKPYLSGDVITAYEYQGQERHSGHFFGRHGNDIKTVLDQVCEFLGEWDRNAEGAIEFLQGEAQAEEQVEAWKSDLLVEYTSLVASIQDTKQSTVTVPDGPTR